MHYVGAECESVVHMLWECSVLSSIRVIFVKKLLELLGDSIKKTWEVSFGNMSAVYVNKNCTMMTRALVNRYTNVR